MFLLLAMTASSLTTMLPASRGNGSRGQTRSSMLRRTCRACGGASPSAVYAVGAFGTILRASSAGYTKEDTCIFDRLHTIWGRGANDIYVGGINGVLLHYDGNDWASVPGAPKQYLRDIWGAPGSSAFYVVGWDGVIIELDRSPRHQGGGKCGEVMEGQVGIQTLNCVTRNRLEGVWAGFKPFAGDGGVPDSAILGDSGVPMIPSAHGVGVNGTLLTGP